MLPWTSPADESVTAKPAFTEAEIRIILSHGPWPAPVPHDPTNRVSGKRDAIEFGTRLFFDQRLSGHGTTSCASCHVPERNWTDNLRRGVGMTELDRNTPTLMNLIAGRWYGWDGAADSLWSQSLRPILDQRELAATPRHVAQLVRSDEQLSCRYRKAFGTPPSPTDDEAVLVNVGKALAAFQETLMSGAHAVRPVPRRPGAGATAFLLELFRAGAARAQDLHRQGRLHHLPCRPQFHQRRVLQHRPVALCAARQARSRTPRRNPATAGEPFQSAGSLQRRQDGGQRRAYPPGIPREDGVRRVQGAVAAQPDTDHALWPRRPRRYARRGRAALRRSRSRPPARERRSPCETPQSHPARADRPGRVPRIVEHLLQSLAP